MAHQIPAFFDFHAAIQPGYRAHRSAVIEAARVTRAALASKPRPRRSRVGVLVIDAEEDFCNPEGPLFVGGRSGNGAVMDCARTAEFIYREIDNITDTESTVDEHSPFQIFFDPFWEQANGGLLTPHTEIILDARGHLVNRVPGGEVLHMDIVPRRELCEWLPGNYTHTDLILETKAYCQALQNKGRYNLYLWPLHCLKGTSGQALSPVIEEAWMYHALVHGKPGHIESKGIEHLSERYSAFTSEVMWGRDHARKIGSRSDGLLTRIQQWQALIVLGQAGSHCVRSSVDDLIRYLLTTSPEFISRIYIVVDCMSSVVVPGVVDYTPQFEESLVRWQAAGCKLVLSTDSMESWPGMREILAA